MTANQVAYWQLQEAKRHNLMEESLKDDIQKAQKKRYDTQNAVDQQNARANTANASTNARNADSNERNASSNERNATSNERNARSKEIDTVVGAIDTGVGLFGKVADIARGLVGLFA